MTLGPIDLHHSGPGIVGCYLLQTEDGPALFDCGPASCVEHLRTGLRSHGLEARIFANTGSAIPIR